MRTDMHAPSQFDPSLYDYVGFIFTGVPDPEYGDPSDEEARHVVRDLPHGGVYGLGKCDHCGAYYSYGAVFVYGDPATDEQKWIAAGHDCAEARFTLPDRFTFESRNIRKRVAARRELGKKRAAVEALYEEVPELAAALEWGREQQEVRHDLDERINTLIEPLPGEEAPVDADEQIRELVREREHYGRFIGYPVSVLNDMHRKLHRYGKLSSAQIEFALKLHAEGQEKLVEAKRKREEVAAMAPLQGGRRPLEGTIKRMKWQRTDFGMQVKMAVALDSGHVVYGTCPDAILDAARDINPHERLSDLLEGQRIRFNATVDPSVGDNDFATFKRPTKPELLGD